MMFTLLGVVSYKLNTKIQRQQGCSWSAGVNCIKRRESSLAQKRREFTSQKKTGVSCLSPYVLIVGWSVLQNMFITFRRTPNLHTLLAYA